MPANARHATEAPGDDLAQVVEDAESITQQTRGDTPPQ